MNKIGLPFTYTALYHPSDARNNPGTLILAKHPQNMSAVWVRPHVSARFLASSADYVSGLPWKTSAVSFLSTHTTAISGFFFFNNMNSFV